MGKSNIPCEEAGQFEILVRLFKNKTPEEIDQMTAAARKEAAARNLAEHKEELGKLFDSQMETLKSRGCPEVIIEDFQKRRSKVISTVAEMDIPDGHIPFLPVIPQAYLGTYGLISMVQFNGNSNYGYTDLSPQGITNVVDVPKGLYFALDVENGEDTYRELSEDAAKTIDSDGRTSLTCDEVLALCLHSKVLSGHYVDALGSRVEDGIGVPAVGHPGARPKLDKRSHLASPIGWGSPSSARLRI